MRFDEIADLLRFHEVSPGKSHQNANGMKTGKRLADEPARKGLVA